jgi:SpoVK/Ycf46/Vps4 family AAA+-type ATPase
VRITEPILEDELSLKISNAVIMFNHKTQWKALGMDRLREMGAALLFHGPPGTGKTITARRLCRVLKLQMHEIDFSQVGSDTPGELSRNIKKLFEQGAVLDTHNNPSMIFLDECDTMLISRSRLGHNQMWMMEPINALLREIGTYPGLIVLATNREPEFLDAALERRLIGKFYFDKPDFLTRVKLWKSKYPKRLPVKLNNASQNGTDWLDRLAHYPLTGAEIENMLVLWVSDTLRRGTEFKLEELLEITRKEHNTDVV